MTQLATTTVFLGVLLTVLSFASVLVWRGRKARLNQRDQQWRETQAITLMSLQERIIAQEELAQAGCPELPAAQGVGLRELSSGTI